MRQIRKMITVPLLDLNLKTLTSFMNSTDQVKYMRSKNNEPNLKPKFTWYKIENETNLWKRNQLARCKCYLSSVHTEANTV